MTQFQSRLVASLAALAITLLSMHAVLIVPPQQPGFVTAPLA